MSSENYKKVLGRLLPVETVLLTPVTLRKLSEISIILIGGRLWMQGLLLQAGTRQSLSRMIFYLII